MTFKRSGEGRSVDQIRLHLAANWIRRDQSYSGELHSEFNLAVADWFDGLAERWSHDATGSEMDAAERLANIVLRGQS